MQALIQWFKKPTKDSVFLYFELLKVMIPIMIVVKICVELGLVELIAKIFTPFMDLVGLPAEAGIIWATAMLVNIYGGIVILIALFPQMDMNVAQLSVLGSMLLIAHALPIEQRICQMAGASFTLTTILRIVGALVYGAILNIIYTSFDLFQASASLPLLPTSAPDDTLVQWLLDSLMSLITIFWIITALVFVLKILEDLKITDMISKALSPLLKLLGMSEKAVPVTMIGVMLGLSYGGALILREAQKGEMSPQDVFLSLSFMCLFHSFIEDTLLIYALGTDIFAILIGRFIFAFIVIFLLAKIIHALPPDILHRFVCKLPMQTKKEGA